MRDEIFTQAYQRLMPQLFRRFHRLAKQAGIRDDRKSFVEDLVSLSLIEALVNSRKPQHNHINCEQLIWIKARNVWAEFWKNRKQSFDHAEHEELKTEWPELEIKGIATDERIEWLQQNADPKTADIIRKRLEGYDVREIAGLYNASPGAITMQIQRLKAKIHSRI